MTKLKKMSQEIRQNDNLGDWGHHAMLDFMFGFVILNQFINLSWFPNHLMKSNCIESFAMDTIFHGGDVALVLEKTSATSKNS